MGESITFSFIGGRVGDTAQVTEWNDVFEAGTELVVFLGSGATGGPAKNVENGGTVHQDACRREG